MDIDGVVSLWLTHIAILTSLQNGNNFLVQQDDDDIVDWDEKESRPADQAPSYIEIEGAVLHSNPYKRPAPNHKVSLLVSMFLLQPLIYYRWLM